LKGKRGGGQKRKSQRLPHCPKKEGRGKLYSITQNNVVRRE